MTQDRVFRVYLSSGRDMRAERDYLRQNAFARLDAELMQHGCRLQVLDLRCAGPDGPEPSEEAVMRHCFAAIESCRPRFIGLLGEGGGEPPYHEDATRPRVELALRNAVSDPATRLEWEDLQAIRAFSVPHMEAYYALRHLPAGGRLFCLREGRLPAGLPPALEEAFAAQPDAHPAAGPDAGWSTVPGAPNRLEALDADIYARLRAGILSELEAEGGSEPAKPPDPLAVAAAFFAERAEGSYPFAIVDRMAALLREDERQTLFLQGVPGCGKSTAMAQLYTRLINEGKTVLPFAGGLGREGKSVEAMLSAFIGALGGKAPEGEGLPELKEAFARALEAFGEPLVILLDDADGLGDSEEAKHATWAPLQLPPHVRLVVSGTPLRGVRPAQEYRLVMMRPKQEEEDMAALLECMAEKMGQEYTSYVCFPAAEKCRRAGSSPIYAKLLTEHLLNMTDEDYDRYTGPQARGDWMQAELRALPENEAGLYEALFARLHRAYGEELTEAVLCLVAVAPNGLHDIDLERRLAAMLGRPAPPLRLFALRHFLRGHLRQDRGAGWWEFEHTGLSGRALGKAEAYGRDRLRALLGDYVE